MPTIAEENTKLIRQGLNVIVGAEISLVEVLSVTASNNYEGSSETVNGEPERDILSDASDGGFLNDGKAYTLDETVTGFISKIGETMTLTVTLAESSIYPIVLIGYLGNQLYKWRKVGAGATRTIQLKDDEKRIRITRVVCGDAWWFDNSNLIECNVDLRAVETKVENPELQMSEIEITGYEPRDITSEIGIIGKGYPIYYTCGYKGDMAPIRRFYLGEPITWEDNQVKLKGYDATMFLDDDFGGEYVGDSAQMNGGGTIRYIDCIDTMLNNAGINHEYDQIYSGAPYSDGEPFFIPKKSKRKVIAQAVNCFRTEFTNIFADPPGKVPLYLNYVDAGIPKLWTGRDTSDFKTLTLISKPDVTVEPNINTIKGDIWTVDLSPNAKEIEKINGKKYMYRETSDPYNSFSTSLGTVTKLTPYSFKLEANGLATISGIRIRSYDDDDLHSPLTISISDPGETVDLEEFHGMLMAGDGSFAYSFWREAFNTMLARSNLLYTFEYRGDPYLQPRDYIKADIDGSGILRNLTIESISIKHSGGGTSSTITARRGFI